VLWSITYLVGHGARITKPQYYLKTGVHKCCALGKHAKTTFPISEHKLRRIIDMIHLDVCGPMTSSYLEGNTYMFFSLLLSLGIVDVLNEYQV